MIRSEDRTKGFIEIRKAREQTPLENFLMGATLCFFTLLDI